MRRVDARVDRHDLDLLVVLQHLRVERVRPGAIEIDDAEEAIGVDLILELAQQAVERSHEAVRPVGAQLARIEDAARATATASMTSCSWS